MGKKMLYLAFVCLPPFLYSQGMMGNCPMPHTEMKVCRAEKHRMGPHIFKEVWMLDLTEKQEEKVAELAKKYAPLFVSKKIDIYRAKRKYEKIKEEKGIEAKETEEALKKVLAIKNEMALLELEAKRELKKAIGEENFEKLMEKKHKLKEMKLEMKHKH